MSERLLGPCGRLVLGAAIGGVGSDGFLGDAIGLRTIVGLSPVVSTGLRGPPAGYIVGTRLTAVLVFVAILAARCAPPRVLMPTLDTRPAPNPAAPVPAAAPAPMPIARLRLVYCTTL